MWGRTRKRMTLKRNLRIIIQTFQARLKPTSDVQLRAAITRARAEVKARIDHWRPDLKKSSNSKGHPQSYRQHPQVPRLTPELTAIWAVVKPYQDVKVPKCLDLGNKAAPNKELFSTTSSIRRSSNRLVNLIQSPLVCRLKSLWYKLKMQRFKLMNGNLL